MFFLQAEDGIRDLTVTGVQTCALPISPWSVRQPGAVRQRAGRGAEAARKLGVLRHVFGGAAMNCIDLHPPPPTSSTSTTSPSGLTSPRRQLCYAVHFQRVAYGDRGSHLRQAG